uniref:hypothetical protein n=1 Tax=Leptolyngbya sp. PCC 6402 TaxID=272136 RepID=UPI0015DEC7A4|nr:hypothetical protein [Leptolyngbya sp. PCC 6402]
MNRNGCGFGNSKLCPKRFGQQLDREFVVVATHVDFLEVEEPRNPNPDFCYPPETVWNFSFDLS